MVHLIVFYAVLPITLGLLLVAALSRIRIRGLTVFRTVLFLPLVIPTSCVGRVDLDVRRRRTDRDGARAVGLGSLGPTGVARRLHLGAAGGRARRHVGAVRPLLVLFMAGVQKIPQSLYDAARVDGAGAVREFFAVTLPNLRGEIAVALVLTDRGAAELRPRLHHDQGRPGHAHPVPAYGYNRAFQTGRVGSAAAIGITLVLIVFVVTFAITRVIERGAR